MSGRFRTTSFERLAGLFLLLTLVGGVLAVWIVARGAGLFQDRSEFRTLLPEAYGVAPGGQVKVRGLVAGRVESVAITDEDDIEVRFSLEDSFAGRLREDAHVEVGASLGLSMVLGGAGLVVEPGSADKGPLSAGATLPVVAGGGFGALAPGLSDDPMVGDARAIVHNIRILTDAVAEDGATVHEALAQVVSLLVAVQDPDHSLGKFLRDDGATYDQVQSLLSRADTIMRKAEPLLGHVDRTLDGADAAIARADTVLAAGGKTVEAMNPVLNEAGKAMRNLDKAVGEFARATKSLATLVKDMNKVVESLDATVRATQQIFPIRKHLKKQEGPYVIKKLLGRTWLKLYGWEAVGELPDPQRAVLIAYPHTSNWDLPFMLAVSWALDIHIHWMGKHTLFKPPMGWLMRYLGGIPVDRRARNGAVGQMADTFAARDELLLAVSPEGTRHVVDHWRSGFYQIALAAKVPIVLGFLDYGGKRGGLGPAFVPSGNAVEDMDEIRAFYAGMTGKRPANARTPKLRMEDEPETPAKT